MTKKLSIIIVTYKSSDVIYNCLDSIEKYNDIGDHMGIIIVDNSPFDDPMYSHVRNKYPWVKVIKNQQNGGFGQGNNLGVKHSTGEFLLFLNPDTILVEKIFGFAIGKFSANTKLAAFGIKLLSANKKPAESFFYRNEYFDFIKYLSIKMLNRLDFFDSNKMFTTGACLFVRKQLFIKAGMFDENIFMYLEEPDLFTRIEQLKEGYSFGYFPEKKIIHLEGELKLVKSRLAQYYKSVFYYFTKYNLDFKKFLKFIVKYLLFKKLVYKLLRKHDSSKEMDIHLDILEVFK